MPRTPLPAQVGRIRSSLKAYRLFAYVTGVFLLILVVEMAFKYGPLIWQAYGYELELGGTQGFLAFVPSDSITAVNLSVAIQIAHGYCYVGYLITDFVLVQRMGWKITRFLVIALGGVVPGLSFFMEARVTREVDESLESLTPKEGAAA